MKLIFCLLTSIAGVLVSAEPLLAQNVTVQQPAFGRFSVGTSVVVPDRGRAFLGGVGRAADSRKRFLGFPSGTSLGQSRQHSGVSTRVWIHDLREMDRRMLQQGAATNAAAGNAAPRGQRLPGYAEHAYRRLHRQHAAQQALRRSAVRDHRTSYRSRASRTRALTGSPTSTPAQRSDRRTSERPADLYSRLARQAEREGHRAKAAYFRRLAAQKGSAAGR